jgi:VIT1/CCC1 family predicted Fe2+/Mn2+ transporter
MTLDTVIMAFGALVAVLPFLQFPQDWTSFFSFIAGIVIIGLGIAVRRRGTRREITSDQSRLFDTEERPLE